MLCACGWAQWPAGLLAPEADALCNACSLGFRLGFLAGDDLKFDSFGVDAIFLKRFRQQIGVLDLQLLLHKDVDHADHQRIVCYAGGAGCF